jgi:nucleoside-diphosphate-sugar epimerase
MVNRRAVLQAGAGILASGSWTRAVAAAAEPKTLLILGGTGFIGPHITDAAMARGWRVSHFNRGKRDPDGVPGVETLIGDRKGQLDALHGRKWDAVIDDTGYIPRFCKMSADLLAPNVAFAAFVSSISAYADFLQPRDESGPTGVLTDPEVENVTNETYGPMKAACERATLDAFSGRSCVVRPGYIVGPKDSNDRFPYWPVRYARGGEMLVPGTPDDPIQIIDARDLAAWMIGLVESRTTGIFNAVSPARMFRMSDLIDACKRTVPNAETKLTWVPEDFLFKHWTKDEMGVPPWAPMGGEEPGFSLTSGERAKQTGLRIRPIYDSMRDTFDWFNTLPAERREQLRAGVDPQKEVETLRQWHEAQQK